MELIHYLCIYIHFITFVSISGIVTSFSKLLKYKIHYGATPDPKKYLVILFCIEITFHIIQLLFWVRRGAHVNIREKRTFWGDILDICRNVSGFSIYILAHAISRTLFKTYFKSNIPRELLDELKMYFKAF